MKNCIINRIIAAAAAFTLSANAAYGAVLGSDITGWSHKIAEGTELYKNEFISADSAVGRQTEYYVKYTPNSAVLPVLADGEGVWGLKNIIRAEEYMKNSGLVPLIGVNASFFSFQTGIPMGIAVDSGKILTKDTEEYPAIGFRNDGSAFIAPIRVTTVLKSGGTELEISHINKYNQEVTPIVNLYTEDFGENNHNDIASLTVLLDEVSGRLGIGDTLSATVCDKFNYQGALEIKKGQLMLTLNENSEQGLYERLDSLEVGDRVEITSYADNAAWNSAESVMGSVGDRLIENGVVGSGFAKGSAPRTAVGITENGEVIFYVLDGRQKGYSYGAKIETVAARLKELGCVDAINLDGGGSTSLLGTYPGKSESDVINSPSEGNLRNCANFIFLKNNALPTGEFGGAYFYPFEQHYLSGYSEEIFLTAVDSAFYPIGLPENVEVSVTGDSSFDSSTNILTARGTGLITVTANYGGISTESYYHSYETPTDILIKDKNGTGISELRLNSGDSVELDFEAWYNGIKLKSNREQFAVSVDGGIGVFENGVLKITSNGGGGVLSVSAGGLVHQIPIYVTNNYPFIDILNHWARDSIKYIFDAGIVSGYEDYSGDIVFKPLKNITREEFAVIICKMLNIDVENVTECNVSFTDDEDIAEWARPYVYEMANRGIIVGMAESGGKIFSSPKRTLTRAEAITVLSRILKLGDVSYAKFADDAEIPEWASGAVYAMLAGGYIAGYPDNTVRPMASVTRAEAAAMICNIIK